MNVRVEYESTPIRHIAIQCPNCKNWFYGRDVTKDDLQFDYQIRFAQCRCPMCEINFGYDPDSRYYTSSNEQSVNIEETSYPEVYKDCKLKKTIWE